MSDRTGVYTSERGDAIQCRSGRPWHVLDPRPEDVRLGDVTRSLARKGRYACHSTRHLSVLEHEVRCCDLSLYLAGCDSFETLQAAAPALDEIPDQLGTASLLWGALRCLCHDSAEAYVEDLPRPLKVNLSDYRLVEAKNDAACWQALVGAAPLMGDLQRVKRVDNLMLAAERAQVMLSEADGGLPWGDLPEWPRCAATDLSAPCWHQDQRSEGDEAECGRISLRAADLDDAMRGEDPGSLEYARLRQRWYALTMEYQETLLRQAWLRRYRLLCGLLGVRECPE